MNSMRKARERVVSDVLAVTGDRGVPKSGNKHVLTLNITEWGWGQMANDQWQIYSEILVHSLPPSSDLNPPPPPQKKKIIIKEEEERENVKKEGTKKEKNEKIMI